MIESLTQVIRMCQLVAYAYICVALYKYDTQFVDIRTKSLCGSIAQFLLLNLCVPDMRVTVVTWETN